ncbi:MAG: penicillin-binding transpeptidase domain-containing protein [Deferrisomatales bacterium]|nr:penicillin-binding transpeptidase domain-containing protein [Deferrisomatales bacterium]
MRDRWRELQEGLQAARGRRRARRRLAAVLLGLLVLSGYAAGRLAPRFEAPGPRPEAQVPELPLPGPTFRELLGQTTWPTPTLGADGGYEEWMEGHRVRYTLDPELQEQALSVFRRYRVPYGALVAMEPATGKLLALAEYSHQEPDLRDFCRRATYPAASLIKMVTAVAVLEAEVAEPETEIRFEGNPYRLFPRKIEPGNRARENNASTVAEAFGTSNNVIFAKLGVELGPEFLEDALERFGFNRSIPFEFPLQESRATVPRDRYPLGRTAAGFGAVYLSPVHAALMAAAVGNGGVMMRPYLVGAVEDGNGRLLYQAAPAPLLRTTSPEVARRVREMMVKTVTRGTSSRVFHRYARRLSRDVGVAGKTGSLTGNDPPGRYEWFVGFAPLEDPKIAVASLIVNHDLWHIKGTYVAQAVMKEFFGM